MTPWESFGDDIAKAAGSSLSAAIRERMGEFAQVLSSMLLDEPGPTDLAANLSERQRFLRQLFDAFTEVQTSLDALQHSPIYLRRFPFAKTEITKLDYLRYHIEAYFNEVYILKERLLVFLTLTGRLYRRDPIHQQLLAATRPLFSTVRASLDGVVKARGAHVHERRFSDPQFSRLNVMGILIRTGGDDLAELVAALKPYHEAEYRRIRTEWRKRISTNNTELLKLLDIVASHLRAVIFPSGGDLKFPVNLRAT